nr:FAD-dependent oxidoreductase [Gemmatimonadales bacterium]
RVTAIQPSEGRVRLEDGELLAYDVLSLAIGASVTAPRVSGGTLAIPLKPIDHTVRLVPELERLVRERGTPAIVVAGAGAAGVETALNIRARLRLAHCAGGRVTVVGGFARLLPERSASAGRLAAQVLAEQSVATKLDVEVGRVDRGRVRLSDGRGLPADLIVWATGAEAPALLGESGLATDRDGFALVDDTLRSVSHPNVFVSGDAAGLRHHPALPKAGVFSVREGPVLWRNLAVSLGAPGKLRPYRPQHRFLALLNTGDGRGILSYGAVAIRGRWVLRLKDRIDRRFMRRFGRLKALGSPSPQDRD